MTHDTFRQRILAFLNFLIRFGIVLCMSAFYVEFADRHSKLFWYSIRDNWRDHLRCTQNYNVWLYIYHLYTIRNHLLVFWNIISQAELRSSYLFYMDTFFTSRIFCPCKNFRYRAAWHHDLYIGHFTESLPWLHFVAKFEMLLGLWFGLIRLLSCALSDSLTVWII